MPRGEKVLHYRVVNFVRKRYPDVIIIAGLGELQNTSHKRIDAWRKGYTKGQPDLIIITPHRTYVGLCIELKTPKGGGVLSEEQSRLLERFNNLRYSTLVSSDYHEITARITNFMYDAIPFST